MAILGKCRTAIVRNVTFAAMDNAVLLTAMFVAPNEDQEPMFWFRGYPVFATYFIVAIYVASMVIGTVAGPAMMSAGVATLGFFSELVHRGEVWRILTYGLINPPSIPFVIDMVIIVWFGRDLERFFGRAKFLRFYAILYLLTPLVFTVLGFIRPMAISGETGGFALFIAFAALYPGAMMFLRLEARWIAVVLVAIYTLQNVFARDTAGLIALWVNVGFAVGFIRHSQGRLELPPFKLPAFGRRQKLRVLPDPPARRRDSPETDAMSDVDGLLDKIARSGMASLSAKERARLEKAREALMKKDRE